LFLRVGKRAGKGGCGGKRPSCTTCIFSVGGERGNYSMFFFAEGGKEGVQGTLTDAKALYWDSNILQISET